MSRTKLLLKRGIFLDKVEDKLPGFHAKLTAIGWLYFAPDPYYANGNWVRELYMNLCIVSLKNPGITIQGKQVNFRAEQISEIYELLDAYME